MIVFNIPGENVFIAKEIVDQLIAQGYVSGRPDLQLAMQDLTEFDRMFYHLPSGVLVTETEEGGCAATAGIAKGDVIIGIDGVRISSINELESALYAKDAGDTITVTVYRYSQRAQYSYTVTLAENKT